MDDLPTKRLSARRSTGTARRSLPGRGLNRSNLVSMRIAVFVANGNVLARPKSVRTEAVTTFVVVLGRLIVVKNPATVFRPAGLMDHETDFVRITLPETANAAVIPMLFPKCNIDMVLAVQRCDKFVTVPRRSLRKLLGSREIKSDAFECVREGRHGLILLGHYNADYHALVRQGHIDLDQPIVPTISARPEDRVFGTMTQGTASQQPVVDFLADPATHGGAPVRRIDTHAASVFLAGNRALKIKRAVRFPFLDFSTLEQRKAACEAEIAVNRAFAPALYRRVIPITRTSKGRLELGGQGLPVEWAVEMRRFDETQTLDRLAQSGTSTRASPTGSAGRWRRLIALLRL